MSFKVMDVQVMVQRTNEVSRIQQNQQYLPLNQEQQTQMQLQKASYLKERMVNKNEEIHKKRVNKDKEEQKGKKEQEAHAKKENNDEKEPQHLGNNLDLRI